MLLFDEHMKENMFSTGSWRNMRTPENLTDKSLNTGSTLLHNSYMDTKSTCEQRGAS